MKNLLIILAIPIVLLGIAVQILSAVVSLCIGILINVGAALYVIGCALIGRKPL